MRYYNDQRYILVEVDSESNQITRDPVTGFAKQIPHPIGGEILVSMDSPSTFLGYYKNPEATEKKFARDVVRNGDLYYRTGDALRRDEEGRWLFSDRLGDTFRWKSENVSTAEVGACLGSCPGVIDANVYGVEIPGYEGRAGCAALLLDDEAKRKVPLEALLR